MASIGISNAGRDSNRESTLSYMLRVGLETRRYCEAIDAERRARRGRNTRVPRVQTSRRKSRFPVGKSNGGW